MGDQTGKEVSGDTQLDDELDEREELTVEMPALDIPAHELARLLNDAFDVELGRKRAELGLTAPSETPARFLKAMLLAGAIGVAAWGGILLLLLALV